MSAIRLPLPPAAPFGDLAPILRPCLARLLARVVLAAPGRVLEAGSSGGLLTALLAETELAQRIGVADFADPAPDTLEAAIARSAAWPWKSHFVNSGLEQLAARPGYDLILTWNLFHQSDAAARAVEACQRSPGWLLTCHEPTEHSAALGYALHGHRIVDTEAYPVSGGRQARCATLWCSTP